MEYFPSCCYVFPRKKRCFLLPASVLLDVSHLQEIFYQWLSKLWEPVSEGSCASFWKVNVHWQSIKQCYWFFPGQIDAMRWVLVETALPWDVSVCPGTGGWAAEMKWLPLAWGCSSPCVGWQTRCEKWCHILPELCMLLAPYFHKDSITAWIAFK